MLFGQVYFAVARCSARESHLARSVNNLRGVSLSQLPLLCFRPPAGAVMSKNGPLMLRA